MPISQKVKNRQELLSHNASTRESVRVNALYILTKMWYVGEIQKSCNCNVSIFQLF